jgi:hypothetical protein
MAAIDDVVKHFIATKKLNPKDSTVFVGWIARQQVYFFRRRGEAIIAAVPTWGSAPNQPDLRARLTAEFTAIVDFLTPRVGKGSVKGFLLPALGGNPAGDKTPKHLDLKDLARRRTSENATGSTVTTRAKDMSWSRLVKVHGIVWRAAALRPEIWTNAPGPGQTTASLAPGVLEEMLDRRLRLLERMQFQISVVGLEERDNDYRGAGGLGVRIAIKKWGDGLTAAQKRWGPWKDGFRIRLFEYPRLAGELKHLEALLDPANRGEIGPPDAEKYLASTHDDPTDIDKTPVSDHNHWEWNSKAKTRVEWRVRHPTMPDTSEWRFPRTEKDDWAAVASNSYYIALKPAAGNTGSSAIDKLFDHASGGVVDLWERAWLWCDHVISACHLEALLFAFRRRLGLMPGEVRFNTLVNATAAPDLPTGGVVPYVTLLAPVGIEDRDDDRTLVSHFNSPHFDEGLGTAHELQLGDHVVFWNHVLYSFLAKGDWRLENALVVSVDGAADGSSTTASQIRLQGHGTGVIQYPGYQATIAAKIEGGLREAQQAVKDKTVGKPENTWPTQISHRNAKIVRWTPYTTIDLVKLGGVKVKVGAWWIEIPFSKTPIGPNKPGTGVPRSADEYRDAVLAAFPRTFARRSGPVSGHTPPPSSTAVYFPLFQPRMAVDLIIGGGPGGKPITSKRFGWSAYFLWHESRAVLKDPPATITNLMDPVIMDGSLVPGLFLRADKKFTIVRPLVK